MNEVVANVLIYAPNITKTKALLMASYNPARAINEFRKGLVLKNYETDITLLDDAWEQSRNKSFYQGDTRAQRKAFSSLKFRELSVSVVKKYS